MVQNIEAEKQSLEEASKLSDEEREENLSLIFISRNKLKAQSRAFINTQPPENTMMEVCTCTVYVVALLFWN